MGTTYLSVWVQYAGFEFIWKTQVQSLVIAQLAYFVL